MTANHDQLILRAAHSSEARAIASISRQQVEYGLTWRWTPARVRQHIADPETIVLIANQVGALQGFAIMKFSDDIAHLLLLAVQPRVRRCGIGSALLNWLEATCITAGIRQIRLEVRAANRVARQFYDRSGFRLVGQLSGYYDRKEAAVVMGRTLVCSTVTP